MLMDSQPTYVSLQLYRNSYLNTVKIVLGAWDPEAGSSGLG